MGVAQHTEMKWLLSNYLSLMCESFLYFRQLQYLVIEHLFVICCSIFCKFCSSFCFSYSLFKSHRCNVAPVTRWRQWLEMGATWLKTYFYCGMENPCLLSMRRYCSMNCNPRLIQFSLFADNSHIKYRY